MARKKSGAFSKVLEIIGLVDDEDTRDSYDDGYEAENYGRQDGYSAQQRSRQDDMRRRPAERDDMRRTGSARYDGQRYGERERYTEQPRRRNTLIERVEDDRDSRSVNGSYRSRERDRYESRGNYQNTAQGRKNYAAAPRSSGRFDELDEGARPASRFAEQPASNNRFDQEPAAPRDTRAASRQRTVMFSLHSLEDCCEVIDNLISNNTVVLTLDELDPKLMQRAVDTLSGAVFALHATIRKASDRTYLIAPSNVEVNESYDMDRRF